MTQGNSENGSHLLKVSEPLRAEGKGCWEQRVQREGHGEKRADAQSSVYNVSGTVWSTARLSVLGLS